MKTMKIVNLKFQSQPTEEQAKLMMNDFFRQEKTQSESQIFCQAALKILQKNTLTKLEEFKHFLCFENIKILENVFQWFVEHEGCATLRKNQQKIAYLTHVYQEEINRREKKLLELENYRKHLKESLTLSQLQNEQRQSKIKQLQGHISSLAKMAKRKALIELNEYGQNLLKSFKIESSGFNTPEQLEFRNKTSPLFTKKKPSLPKKFFLTDGRNLNRNSTGDVQLFLKSNKTEASFRMNKTQMTKRHDTKKLKKIQAQRDITEDLRRLEEQKQNCLHHMSERIVLFQNKLADIEEKLEAKKQILGSIAQ